MNKHMAAMAERVTIKWKERKSKQRGKLKCTGVNETWPVHAYIKM